MLAKTWQKLEPFGKKKKPKLKEFLTKLACENAHDAFSLLWLMWDGPSQ